MDTHRVSRNDSGILTPQFAADAMGFHAIDESGFDWGRIGLNLCNFG
jgi:hypothetical protein